MSPPHHNCRSRRLSRKAPVEVADYDWQDADSPQLLYCGSDVEIKSSAIRPNPPSPSACTSNSSNSPHPLVTHLPFTPGSSHTRNRKEGHIPRPPNAFMVFRSWLWNKDNLKSIEKDNRNVSRIAGRCWHELSEAERAPFRSMAEEAKARHAQLYPEYRYSPGSLKKPKVTQRRSQRSLEVENAKCNKVVDLLLGSATSRDLAKRLSEDTKDPPHQDILTAVEEFGISNEAPRNKRTRAAAPRADSPPPQLRSKKQKTLLSSPPTTTPSSQYSLPLPVLTVTDEYSELAPTPQLTVRTPELMYPPDILEEFVPTDNIPYLCLDGCNNLLAKGEDKYLPPLFPSHLKPGVCSVFSSGVKPEATSFVDSCMLGTYTADAFGLPAATPVPFTDFDIERYSSSDTELVPLGSPVFTNPFEPSNPTVEHAALLGTLDQLFGQSVSPHTQVFSIENW